MVCINQILLFFFDCGGTANNSQCRDGLQRSILTPWDTSLTFARGWWLVVVSACLYSNHTLFPYPLEWAHFLFHLLATNMETGE